MLRVVRTALATEPDVRAQAEVAEYFMDYHNADGSIAEMCGNGVRVFGRYLLEAGLITGATRVATRGGPKALAFDGTDITVTMGRAVQRSETPTVSVTGLSGERYGGAGFGGAGFSGIAFDLPNPHVVVELDSVPQLVGLDLSTPPTVRPALPEGQNVEFFVRTEPGRIRLRVHERGVGETRSCGTGICAAVVAASQTEPEVTRWQVDVPGGRCEVWWSAAGEVMLSGPAVLVATVQLSESWLAEHR